MKLSIPLADFSTLTKGQLARYYRAGLETLRDVVFNVPNRYENYQKISLIRDLKHNELAQVQARVLSAKMINGKRSFFRVEIGDEFANHCSVVLFNFIPEKLREFRIGREGIFYGKPTWSAYGFSFAHPKIIWLDEEQSPANIQPIYGAKFNYKTWTQLVDEALEFLDDDSPLNGLPSFKQALHDLHRPRSMEAISTARQRLAFEELLAQQIGLNLMRAERNALKTHALTEPLQILSPLQDLLPFPLTEAQKRAIAEIVQDLQQPRPMHRLLQGDVGSGKTLVAFFACIFTALHEKQAVLLAPTEILAEQHFSNFQKFFKDLDINAVLLTRREKKSLAAIADGSAKIVIGTHAVFQEKVQYHDLALAVVDEQHRFGVMQRAKLQQKGQLMPHQLTMTATPIPRTLAMAQYGDIHFSSLNERPKGRQEIITTLLHETKRAHLIERVGAKCREGAQAYWVCPAIDESEHFEDVIQTADMLQKALPDVKISLVHGKQNADERQELMRDFVAGKTQILVATTVIEVGVDVPNASLMVIENAERFGLAQLHQLRGRVGRGSVQSHCVLLFSDNLSNIARARLNILKETTDGFFIAEEDLRLRGAGEILGERQAGVNLYAFVDWAQDLDLLKQAQEFADPEDSLQREIFQRWQFDEEINN